MSSIMQVVHDSKLSDHYKFARSCPDWAIVIRDKKAHNVKKYIKECMNCQNHNDFRIEKPSTLEALEICEWG